MPMIAYFDCFSGAAGDMLLGALLDSGYPLEDLRSGLAALNVSGFDISLQRVQQHGITGSKFDVIDLAGERPVRNLSLIREILSKAELPEGVADQSLRVFTRLGEAEARIHGVSIDQVHFHEVGAIDALVDVVGTCLVLHNLGVERVYASALPLGNGTIRTEHGLLPVPAPATLALIAEAGAPTLPLDAHGELVTPTGAALLTTLATFERPAMRVSRVGYGFGTKTFPWPNMVRVWIGEALSGDLRRPGQTSGHAAHAEAAGEHSHAPGGEENLHSHGHAGEAHEHPHTHAGGHEHAHHHEAGDDHTHSHDDGHQHSDANV
jgi:uncharacterized protein (TIGR00299 family) protein